MGTNHMSFHVDRLRCCQLRWTVSVINWWPSLVTGVTNFVTLAVDICLQHGEREAQRRAGLSATAENCKTVIWLPTNGQAFTII